MREESLLVFCRGRGRTLDSLDWNESTIFAVRHRTVSLRNELQARLNNRLKNFHEFKVVLRFKNILPSYLEIQVLRVEPV